MAYLKGGSYVDGDFYVEGTLKVNRIANSANEFFPYLTTAGSSKTHYLVWFGSNDGAIEYSPIKADIANTEITLALDSARTGSSTSTLDSLSIAATEDHVKILSKEIRLNTSEAIPRWEYVS